MSPAIRYRVHNSGATSQSQTKEWLSNSLGWALWLWNPIWIRNKAGIYKIPVTMHGLEIIVLRQQLSVFKRKTPRLRLWKVDRVFLYCFFIIEHVIVLILLQSPHTLQWGVLCSEPPSKLQYPSNNSFQIQAHFSQKIICNPHSFPARGRYWSGGQPDIPSGEAEAF